MTARRSGLGLAELMIAVALLGVLLSILYSGEIALRKNARALEHRSRAILAAQEYLELTCAALPTTGPREWSAKVLNQPGIMTGTLAVSPCPRFPFLRSVTLTVTWSDPAVSGPEHRLVLSRLVPDRVTP
jgi:prepilin-type N-terminal cleavage/methylation domain-containing protein